MMGAKQDEMEDGTLQGDLDLGVGPNFQRMNP